MVARRQFLKFGLGAGVAAALPVVSANGTDRPPVDVTFLVINDVHACRIGDGLGPRCLDQGKTDENLLRHIRALNGIIERKWPAEIAGKPSGLSAAGQPVGRPAGVIVCGDVTDYGGGQAPDFRIGPQILQFTSRYQEGSGPERIHYPVYVGLGNHDLDMDAKPPRVDLYRDQLRDYVQVNHKPSAFFKAPVPVDNYDSASDSYSWNWGGLHLVQAHRYVGDTEKHMPSNIDWLKRDLQAYAADGRPIIIFQHYGWDPFSTERWDPVRKTFAPDGTGQPHWWSEASREALLSLLSGYNVIGLFHGHEHDMPMAYRVGALDIFKAKAAYLGGFCLVRVTSTAMDVAIGEAAGDAGEVTFTNAFSKALGV